MGNNKRKNVKQRKENKVVNITSRKIRQKPLNSDSQTSYVNIGMDKNLLMYVLILLAFGLVMIYSASSYEAMLKFGNAQYYLTRQLLATIIALAFMILASLIDYHWILKFYKPFYWLSVILIILVLTPLGKEINGARRWLGKGSISLQPAEVAKLAIIILTAVLISKASKAALAKPFNMFVILSPGIFMFLLVWRITKNLSSATIILLIPTVMIFVASKNYKIFLISGLVVVGLVGILIVLISTGLISIDASFRIARVAAWLHPEAFADDKAFQTLQALYSIGSGGVFGKGLGESMQKMGSLPEAQNDMIFSIICEELGLFGAFAVMILFICLIWRCAKAAEYAVDLKGSMIAVGVMAHIASQVVLNIAVVTNTIPNTGVTLPFISYGGSSIVFTLIEIGMVLNVTRRIADE